eukprot:Colp12_sorted_trinity150504_noHs@25412
MATGEQAAQAAQNLIFTSRYMTVKHSWRGKYKRIFAIGPTCVATVNPTSLEITNTWPYSGNAEELFADIAPSPKAASEFVITLRKGKKTSTLTFQCDHRANLLTDVNKYRALFTTEGLSAGTFQVQKYHWSERKVDATLK